MIYLPLAIEIANERSREAEHLARTAALVAASRAAASGVSTPPRRPSRARALIATPFRAFSDASHAVSEAACTAATRIEGPAR